MRTDDMELYRKYMKLIEQGSANAQRWREVFQPDNQDHINTLEAALCDSDDQNLVWFVMALLTELPQE